MAIPLASTKLTALEIVQIRRVRSTEIAASVVKRRTGRGPLQCAVSLGSHNALQNAPLNRRNRHSQFKNPA
jgi:hypothetical protein